MIAMEDFEGFACRDWQRSDEDEGPIRIAMIGLGWWTRDRAMPAVDDSVFCETTTVVSGSKDKTRDVLETHSTVEHGLTYEEFYDGAAADAYDAVYVATPNAAHSEYVETAADLDKGVLCEKPMESTVDRAATLLKAAQETTLMIAYRMQTEPAVRRMRELIRERFIGDPVEVHGRMSQRLLEMNPDPDQWRLDPDLAGYGTSVMDLGPYPLNTARFVLDADPVRARATMASPSVGFEAVPDERATFLLEFPDDVTASCSVSQNAHQSDRFTVLGTEGELSLIRAFHGSDRRELTLVRGDVRSILDIEPVDQMTEEFDYFADCLLAGETPHPDGEHGLLDMRAMKAIYNAAERDEPVAIEP